MSVPVNIRAGVFLRIMSLLIDLICIVLIFNILRLLFHGENEFPRILIFGTNESSVKSMNIPELLSVLIFFSSEIFFPFSIGKLILKLRISARDGSPAGLRTRAKRYIIKNIFFM